MNDSLTSDSDTSYDSSARTTPESPYAVNSYSPGNPLARKALRLLSRPPKSTRQDKRKRYSVQEHSFHNNGQYNNLREGPEEHKYNHRVRSGSNSLYRRPKSHIIYPYVHSNFSASQPALNSIGEVEIETTGFYGDQDSTAQLGVKSAQFHSSTVDVAYPQLIKHSLEDLLHIPGPVAVKTPTVPRVESPESNGSQGSCTPYSDRFGWSDARLRLEHINPRSIMKPVPVEVPKAPRSKRVSFTGSENFQLSNEVGNNLLTNGVNCEGSEAETSPCAVNKLPHTCRPTSHGLPNGVYRSRSYSYNGPLSTDTTSIKSINNQLHLQATAHTINTNGVCSVSSMPHDQMQTGVSVGSLQSIVKLGSSPIPEDLVGYPGESQTTSKPDHIPAPPTYVTRQADAIDKQPQASVIRSPPHLVSLSTYASSSESQFPKRVRISKGVVYPSGGMAVSVGHELNLHFLKRVKVVLMQDSRGNSYVLPLQTSIRASIVYDPSGSEKISSKDSKFKSAGDIMNLKHIPLVIAATKKYNAGSSSSVEGGEILIVRGIKTNSNSGRCLKVQSINGTKKLLNENCAANFTTKPSLTRLSMQELFNSKIQLPQKAILHVPPTFQQGTILPSVITFSQYTTATSVIATDAFLLADTVPTRVLELSSNLDIELQETVGVSEIVEVKLLQTTKSIFQSFDPSKTTHCFDVPRTVMHELQCALYKSLSTINPSFGMELIKPNKAKSHPLHTPLASSTITDDFVDASQTETEQESQLTSTNTNTASDPSVELSTVRELTEQVRTLEDRCSKTDQLLTSFSRQFEHINSVLSKLQNDSPSSTRTVKHPASIPHPLQEHSHRLSGSQNDSSNNLTRKKGVTALPFASSSPIKKADILSSKVGVTDLSINADIQATGHTQDASGKIGITVIETCTQNPPVGSNAAPKVHNGNKHHILVTDALDSECSSSTSSIQSNETTSVIIPKEMEHHSPKRGYLAKRMNRAIARFDKLRGKKESRTTVTSGSKGTQQAEHIQHETSPSTDQMNKHTLTEIDAGESTKRQSTHLPQAVQENPHLQPTDSTTPQEVSFKNKNQNGDPKSTKRTTNKPAVLPKPAGLQRDIGLNVKQRNSPGVKASPSKPQTKSIGSDNTNLSKGSRNQAGKSTGVVPTNRMDLELSLDQQKTLVTFEHPAKPSPTTESVPPIHPEPQCPGETLIVDTAPKNLQTDRNTSTTVEVSVSEQNSDTRPKDCITVDGSIPIPKWLDSSSLDIPENVKPNNLISNMRNDNPSDGSLQDESEDLDLLVDNIAAWCSQMEAEVSQMSLADFQG